MHPIEGLTKVSFNAIPKTMAALEVASDRASISRTDTLNRAVLIYEATTGLSWWRAVWLLFIERATVRRFAAEAKAEDAVNG